MLKEAMVFLLVAFGWLTPALAADFPVPDRSAVAFYNLYLKTKPHGVPDAAMVRRFKPLLSARLASALGKAEAAEVAHVKATNNAEPPLFEGDLFTSLYEGASSYSIEGCTTEGAHAYCDVELAYAEVPGATPTTWTDRLVLAKRVGGWTVDDIVFGGSWDFGQHGTLRATLAEIIKSGTP